MRLTDSELADLRARLTLAEQRGYRFARVNEYATALLHELERNEPKVECSTSLADLLGLVDAVIAARASGVKEAGRKPRASEVEPRENEATPANPRRSTGARESARTKSPS